MTYRNNQEFIDSQKKGVKELVIFMDNVQHCIINDNENAVDTINAIKKCYPDKIIRIVKGGEK